MKKKTYRPITDTLFKHSTLISALITILLLLLFFLALLINSWKSIEHSGIGFFTSSTWNPVTEHYGALSSIFGTVVSTLIAIVIAVPVGILTAFFLVEIAPSFIATPVGYAVELLAAIPSIIYGMWGLFVFSPFVASHIQPFLSKLPLVKPLFEGPPMGIGLFTAGIILAIMILPFITSVTRDVLKMVPASLKEAAYGMGATRWEVTYHISLRYGIKGIMGGIFLGMGRALGETMAVTFVIGNTHRIALSLFTPANTITSTLANEFAEASDPLYLSALTELGLILFVITFLINTLSYFMLKRYENGEKKR